MSYTETFCPASLHTHTRTHAHTHTVCSSNGVTVEGFDAVRTAAGDRADALIV